MSPGPSSPAGPPPYPAEEGGGQSSSGPWAAPADGGTGFPSAPPSASAEPFPSAPPPSPSWTAQATPPVPKPGRDGFAIAALVFCIIPVTILAVPFAIIALVRTRKSGQKGRGMAITALVLSVIWMILGGLIAAFLLSIATGEVTRDAGGRVTERTTTLLTNVQDGDCMTDSPGTGLQHDVELIPCDQPHRAQVFAAFAVEGSTFPGVDAVATIANDGCSERLPQDIDPALADTLETLYYAPTQKSWDEGDRNVLCVFVSESDLTKSIG